MMFLWALLYYVLPDVEQEFKFITPGSVVGVLLWVVASWGFGKYVSNFGSYDKTYGSIAGVIVLLFWMWISSLVLLVGAEVNALIEHRSPEGKREGAKSMRNRHHPDAGRSGAGAHGGRPPSRRTPARAGRPRGALRGLVGIAAGFAAGVLLMRRET